MTAAPEHEARIDAELKETEKSIQELQKKRAELMKAKSALARGKTTAPASDPAPQPANPASTKALETTLNSLEWSSFKKREGEWAFLRNRDGSLVDALVKETEFVNQLRRGRELVVGRYRYSVSEDKFLNRHFHA